MKDKKEHRRRVVKRRTRPQTAPGRLGWLGGGLTSALASASMGNDNRNNIPIDDANNNNDDDNDVNNAGSQSSSGEKLLTPRPDCDITNTTSTITGGDAIVDLTGDNSNIMSSWTCRKCTLINSRSLSVCDACNARRESTRSGSKINQCDLTFGEDGIYGDGEQELGSSKKQKLKVPSGKANVMNKQQMQKQPHNDNNKKKTTLSWQSSLLSQHSFSSQSNTNKKSKTTSFNTSKMKSSTTTTARSTNNRKCTEMWIDKHAPTSIKELCVAPKKIDEVRNLLSSHISYTAFQRRKQKQNRHPQSNITTTNPSTNNNPWEQISNNDIQQPTPPQTKLMILVGSSGIGKSTMIKTLAREMNIEIITWNDIHVDYNMNQQQHAYDGGDGSRGGMTCLPYQSQLNSFEEFFKSGGVGMKSLDLLVADDDYDDDSSLFENQSVKKRKGGGKMGNNDTDKEYVGSLILVEEIPNLYNAEAAQSFRNIMERHIYQTQTPTFFIFSDVQEGKHRPEDLERLIPSHILYSPLVQILPIQPVTKSKMKKSLQAIAKVERLGSLSTEFVEEIHLSSGGDLRHAIFAMQFQCSSSITTTTMARTSNDGEEDSSNGGAKKDAKLSTFHALGKLLYAKRKPSTQQQYHDFDDDFMDDDVTSSHPSSQPATTATLWNQSKWNDGRGRLEFVPEEVLGHIDMGLGSALTFLSYHSPDFFTDVTDLSRSFGLLSDAAAFVDYQYVGQTTDGPFPTQYAACIGGRAVADGNKHPAPPQFRQFTAPKVFSVMKKNRENEIKIGQLRKRLSTTMGGRGGSGSGKEKTSIHDNIGSAQQFVTDSLPYMRTVIPQDVNYALANLHSYANDASGQALANEPVLEEENVVLLEDDLVDDDDDNW